MIIILFLLRFVKQKILFLSGFIDFFHFRQKNIVFYCMFCNIAHYIVKKETFKHNNYAVYFARIGFSFLEITAVNIQKTRSVGIKTTRPASKTAPKSKTSPK